MTCDQAMALLSAKIDGALTPEEAQQLQAHLDACPDCRALLEAMTSMEDKVKGLEQPVPERFREGVMYRIEQEIGNKKSKRRFLGVGTGMGLVAAALVLMIGAGIIRLPKPARDTAADRAVVQTEQREPIRSELLPGAAEGAVSEPANESEAYVYDPTDGREAENETTGKSIEIRRPEWQNHAGALTPENNASEGTSFIIDPEPVAPLPSQVVVTAPESSAAERDLFPEPESPADLEAPLETEPEGAAESPDSEPAEASNPAEPAWTDSISPGEAPTVDDCCAELSRLCDTPVLFYADLSADSLLALLRQEEPALFEVLSAQEPDALTAMTELAPEQECTVFSVSWEEALSLQKWLLQNLPGSAAGGEADDTVFLERMEALDPGSEALYRVITWAPRAELTAWPEDWPADWAQRMRSGEGWTLYFPDENWSPLRDDLTFVVLPTE